MRSCDIGIDITTKYNKKGYKKSPITHKDVVKIDAERTKTAEPQGNAGYSKLYKT